MARSITLALVLLLLITLPLSMPVFAPSMVVASSQGRGSVVKEFTVVVGEPGFNGTWEILKIRVNQGDRVRINFVYGDVDLAQDNPHKITIEGYNIVTDPLSKGRPLIVVEFTAGQVGEFGFYCILACLGHENLQNGLLVVSLPEGGLYHTVAIEITHLELHTLNPDYPQLYALHVVARLRDEESRPVVGVLVDLYVNTTFGPMKVASNATEADGTTDLLYRFTPRATQVAAYFRGSGSYQASNITQAFTPDISITEPDTTPYMRGQNSLIDLRLIGVEPGVAATLVTVLLLTVGSVWLTYAYVLRQILRIRRHNSRSVGGVD